MMKILSLAHAATLLLVSSGSAFSSANIAASQTEPPATPEFRSPEYPAYENDLIFGIHNPNGTGSTEIFRSLSATEGFQRIASIPASEHTYLDEDLHPRTTYYYRLRAEAGGLYSSFSDVLSLTSGSKLYAPVISAQGTGSTVIEVTVHDRSYNDVSYDVWREQGAGGELIETINAPDSGEVFLITDSGLQPNTSYHYRVDVHAKGPGNVFYAGMATTGPVTTGEQTLEPPVLSFHEPPTHFTCGNQIGLFYSNPDEEATTEIYRSQNSDSGFLLAYAAEGSGSYLDEDLSSNKTYYYKARSVKGDAVSAFSPVISSQSGYALYQPGIDVAILPNQTVQVTVRDRSYLDYSYELYGWDAEAGLHTLTTTFQLPDSGQAFTITDTEVEAGKTYTYHVNVTLNCDGYPVHPEEFVSEPVTVGSELEAPAFSNNPPFEFFCESTIAFEYLNPNAESTTEIYRSEDRESGYELIASVPAAESRFVDESPRSNITYYYKLRAVNDGAASEYSAVWSMLSPSDFYAPQLTATGTEGGVQLQLLDKSYADLHYYIRRHETGSDAWQELPLTITMPDSGQVFTYLDESALANRAYRYYVDATLNCDGQPQHYDVAYADVETESTTEVFGFTLVDPVTDMDVGELQDGMEFRADDRLNIRANTNDVTRSVAFFINGTRYWGENQEPYALFCDRYGDYKPGRFQPGTYTLTAVPYSENLHRGEAGASKTVSFTVTDANGKAEGGTYARISVYPNPVIEQATIEVAGSPDTPVMIAIMDRSGNAVERSAERLDSFGWLVRGWNTTGWPKGTYYLTVEVDAEKHVERLIVK